MLLKKFIFISVLLCTVFSSRGTVTQPFEDLVPGERTYTRIDGKLLFCLRWCRYPEHAVIVSLDTRLGEVWIKDPVHNSSFDWWYNTRCTYEQFNEYYQEEPTCLQ